VILCIQQEELSYELCVPRIMMMMMMMMMQKNS